MSTNVRLDIKTNIINSISIYHIIRLLKIIYKNNIDVIHTHLSKASILGGLTGKISGIKSFATVHGINSYKDYYLNDRLIAVSNAVKNNLIKTGADKNKIKVIYNGIENNGNYKKEKFFSDNSLSLIYIGRLSGEKNLDFLIKTLYEWKANNWNLKIVGDGEEYNKLNKLINSCNLKEKINLLGFRNDIFKYLLKSDFVILPSKKEGFGLSIIEGFSVGIPAIGSNVGGIKEIIENKTNGFLFEPSDKKNLLNILSNIVEKKDFRYWSNNAYKTYKEKFNINKNTEDVLNFYEKK